MAAMPAAPKRGGKQPRIDIRGPHVPRYSDAHCHATPKEANAMRIHCLMLALAAAMLSATPGMAQDSDLAKYCKADIDRLCSNVAPGGGRLLTCLKSHSKEMSVGCAQALQKMKKG